MSWAKWVTEELNAILHISNHIASLESSLGTRWPRFVAKDYLKGIIDRASPLLLLPVQQFVHGNVCPGKTWNPPDVNKYFLMWHTLTTTTTRKRDGSVGEQVLFGFRIHYATHPPFLWLQIVHLYGLGNKLEDNPLPYTLLFVVGPV